MRTNEFGQPVGEPVPGWTPPPPVTEVTLTGRHCTVEPLADRHLDDLHRALVVESPPETWTYLSRGPFADRSGLEDYLEGLRAPADWAAHAILDREGRAQGVACYLRIAPAAGSVEVGGLTFGPALRRTTAATEAMHLMAAHAFELGYRRYEWKCDALNAPSRAAARRLGFRPEGIFRNALVYKGRNRDTAWFAITDSDWPRIREAHRSWLAPANFDATGRARTSLSDLTAVDTMPHVGTAISHDGTHGRLS